MITSATIKQLVIGIPTIAFCVFLIIWSIQQIYHHSYPYRIRHNSPRYHDVAALNNQEEFIFYKAEPHPEHTKFLFHKDEFDNFDFDQAMLQLIADETEMFDRQIFATSQNKETLRRYHKALEQCSPPLDQMRAEMLGFDYPKASAEEARQIQNILPNPVTDADFTYIIIYYCPVKKTHMRVSKVYPIEEVIRLRQKDSYYGPVETIINCPHHRGDMWQLAEVDFRYNAEDDFQY